MSASGSILAAFDVARPDVRLLCGCDRAWVRSGCCVMYSEANVSDELLLNE